MYCLVALWLTTTQSLALAPLITYAVRPLRSVPSPGVGRAAEVVALSENMEIGRAEVFAVVDAGAQRLHARAEHGHAKYAFLTNVLVATHMRRRGVGTRLLKTVEELASRWSCTAVVCSAVPSHVPSWTFFRKLGYRPIDALLSPHSTSEILLKELLV